MSNNFFNQHKKKFFIVAFLLFMLANIIVVWHLGSFTEFRKFKKKEQSR
jgi:hypothetical protein